jgi:hypothetical protein
VNQSDIASMRGVHKGSLAMPIERVYIRPAIQKLTDAFGITHLRCRKPLLIHDA